jgi:hypothetical protein
MYKISGKGAGGAARLQADAKLTPADFADIAKELGQAPVRARKIGYVAARRAENSEVIETRWNGKETTNTARAGDWIVTNLSLQRVPLRDREGHANSYVIVPEKFAGLYEPTPEKSALGDVYRAKGVVLALPLPGAFDIVAPWGERQIGSAGHLLLNGDEVYGANAETFAATYVVESVS